MLLEPNVFVLYADDLEQTSNFYQDIFGTKPEKHSTTFQAFTLSNGMVLALKARDSVAPPPIGKNGNMELAFTLDSSQKVDRLFAEWQAKEINIALAPNMSPFGYTFVALDPDGNRLRVVSLNVNP